MKLRSAILVGVLLLVAAIIVVTIGVASWVLQGAAYQEVQSQLSQSEQVLDDLLTYRQSLFRAQARVVANEPRLKAVVATQEVTPETTFGVAQELQKTAASDIFLLTDGAGQILADVADPEAYGFDLSAKPLVAAAISKGEASGIWTDKAAAYQVQARSLSFGTTTVGILVTGYKLDDRFAAILARQTGSNVIVELNKKAIAQSMNSGEPLTEILSQIGDTASEVSLGGARYLAVGKTLPDYHGEARPRVVLLRSIDAAMAPSQDLQGLLYLIGAGSLLVALLFAFFLAGRLARPLDSLVSFTRKISEGDLSGRVDARGFAEVGVLSSAMNDMVAELGSSRKQLVNKERLERELEIAARIQTTILPKKPTVKGLQIAAEMIPASEVGGDYYDVLPQKDGCFIGIGDVAGHGLTAGLVMVMIQSVVAALVRQCPDATPRELVIALNDVLYENIRQRLTQDEHVTFSLLRYQNNGQVTFAGAHEDILVCRAQSGQVERIQTPGSWLGAMPKVDKFTVDNSFTVAPGDLIVLYTDGITEAQNEKREQYGIERMSALVARLRQESVEHIRGQLLDEVKRWTKNQDDDITLLVIRYQGDGREHDA
jgi:sigma-B regulation protein RsbU (phosphoserine phosphatase)